MSFSWHKLKWNTKSSVNTRNIISLRILMLAVCFAWNSSVLCSQVIYIDRPRLGNAVNSINHLVAYEMTISGKRMVILFGSANHRRVEKEGKNPSTLRRGGYTNKGDLLWTQISNRQYLWSAKWCESILINNNDWNSTWKFLSYVGGENAAHFIYIYFMSEHAFIYIGKRRASLCTSKGCAKTQSVNFLYEIITFLSIKVESTGTIPNANHNDAIYKQTKIVAIFSFPWSYSFERQIPTFTSKFSKISPQPGPSRFLTRKDTRKKCEKNKINTYDRTRSCKTIYAREPVEKFSGNVPILGPGLRSNKQQTAATTEQQTDEHTNGAK